ncbi:MAG: glycosyltransferase family 2 protein [Sulfurovaceae bacterium]
MTNLISVILPVYNGALYLDEAIKSILSQTYSNFEFIIINDGSTDNSLEIINRYTPIDDRMKVISRENRGLITSLNEGIEKSEGTYIARIDQDDVSLPGRLEIQLNYMLKNHLDICGGDFTKIDAQNNVLEEHKVPKTESEIIITLATNMPFAHSCVMIKKCFLSKNNLKYGLNGYRNAEDLDLWILMYENGAKFGNVDARILKYRILPSSMSRTNRKEIKRESNIQFNNFIKNNREDFENRFQILLKQKNISNAIQRDMMRAIIRYSLLTHRTNLIFKTILKLKMSNIVMGILSFIKLRIYVI